MSLQKIVTCYKFLMRKPWFNSFYSFLMSFVAFCCTMGNWCGNPCIFYVMNYTVGWESDGKKALVLWDKYEYQFPKFFPGFVAFFRAMGNRSENTCISRIMGGNFQFFILFWPLPNKEFLQSHFLLRSSPFVPMTSLVGIVQYTSSWHLCL